MQPWYTNTKLWFALGLAVLIVVLFWLAGGFLQRKMMPWVDKRKKKKPGEVLNIMLSGFTRPLATWLRITGFGTATLIFAHALPGDAPTALLTIMAGLRPFTYRFLRIFTIICAAWGLVRSSDLIPQLFNSTRNRLDLHMTRSASRFLGAIFKVIIIAIASTIVLNELGLDVNGIITGLGLGGLTIALAAKDTASNFFGGLVLVFEKPFEIGDYIICNAIEGVVEDISLRSTRIRTSAGTIVVVPNATLASAPITNTSVKSKKHRADIRLRVEYNTDSGKLRSFVDAVRTLLETDPDVVDASINVALVGFDDSGLQVRILFDSAKTAFADYTQVCERIDYALLSLAEQNGIRFAYPAQTLHIQNS